MSTFPGKPLEQDSGFPLASSPAPNFGYPRPPFSFDNAAAAQSLPSPTSGFFKASFDPSFKRPDEGSNDKVWARDKMFAVLSEELSEARRQVGLYQSSIREFLGKGMAATAEETRKELAAAQLRLPEIQQAMNEFLISVHNGTWACKTLPAATTTGGEDSKMSS